MAMRLFRVVVVSLAVLLLGSCNVLQYIFGSVFPSTMTLIKAQANVNGLMPADRTASANIRIVETGGYGYVVVTGSTSAAGAYAIFYDLDLHYKMSLIGATAPSGTGVMADANGVNINAGGKLLDPATLATVGSGTIVNSDFSAGNDGFVSNGNDINGFNTQGGSTISYFVNSIMYSTPVLSSTLSSLQIDAVLDDGAGKVIMVISQSGSSNSNNNGVRVYFLTIASSAFPAFPTYALDSAPQRDNLDYNSFGFANGSVFAYDTKTSSYVRINPADASIQSSFPSATNNNQQPEFAYRVSGGSFYCFDTNTRILTKYTAWW
jgi:hypothetical protein